MKSLKVLQIDNPKVELNPKPKKTSILGKFGILKNTYLCIKHGTLETVVFFFFKHRHIQENYSYIVCHSRQAIRTILVINSKCRFRMHLLAYNFYTIHATAMILSLQQDFCMFFYFDKL